MNSLIVFSASSFALLVLAVLHFIAWRYAWAIRKMKNLFFKTSKPLPMPIKDSSAGEPGKVYARIKKAFMDGNDDTCELPLIYLISLDLSKDFQDIQELLARCYIAKKQYKKAEIVLKEALVAGDERAVYFALLAEVCVKQKKTIEAAEILKTALGSLMNMDISKDMYEDLLHSASKTKNKTLVLDIKKLSK
jgi:tetratricopeptide (TPR) repeat protein